MSLVCRSLTPCAGQQILKPLQAFAADPEPRCEYDRRRRLRQGGPLPNLGVTLPGKRSHAPRPEERRGRRV
jgi:hypothetical protein